MHFIGKMTKLRLFVAELFVSIACATAFNLTILHTNDFHTRFEETDQNGGECNDELRESAQGCFGGIARRATVIDELRAQSDHGNVLLLDAGDAFTGTNWFYVYRGNATAHFMNVLGYDAMALGNHEFDIGIDILLPFLNNVTFPVLSCNINSSTEPRLQGLYVCSHVFEMGGDRVGVVGYTLQSTPNYAYTESLIFEEEIPAVQEAVINLQQEGVNKIIALGHSGFSLDQEIARSVEGVDIVVGGHTNTFIFTGDPPSNQVPVGEYPYIVHPAYDSEASVLVVTAYAYGKYLGNLDVVFDEEGVVTEYAGNPILLDNTVQPDPATQADLDIWQVRVDEVSDSVVGSTLNHLEGDIDICGYQECNLGNMLADSMLFNHGMDWDDVNIAVTIAGSISASIYQGNITIGHLILVLPYSDTIDRVRLLGRDLLQMLEVPVLDASVHDQFLQVSGLVIEYDLTRESGDRVYRAQYRCMRCTGDDASELMDIDPDMVYGVIMNTFQAGGGAGYGIVKETKLDHTYGRYDVDITAEYVEANSPLNAAVEGRIIVYDENNRPNSGGAVTPHKTLILLLPLTMLLKLLM